MRLWMVLAPAAALVLTGCGGGKPTVQATHASPSASPKTPTASASPAAAKPADGTRLAACSDAKCEVEVRAGDVLHFHGRAMGRAGFGDVTVKSVRANGVVFRLASGRATFTQPGPNGTANVNGISLTLVRTDGKRAVIRIGGPKAGALSLAVGPGGMTVTTPGD